MDLPRSDSESGAQSAVPRIRSNTGPKKSVAWKLWDLLQPLARLWGLITSVGSVLAVCLQTWHAKFGLSLCRSYKALKDEWFSVMSGAGAELWVLGYEIALGLIFGAAFVFTLETMWVAALFIDLLCRRGEYTVTLRCWDFFRWSCGRARAPFYACVATALLFANLTMLTTVAGGMLLVLAALRAAVPFSPYATHGPHSPRAGSSLLSQHDSPMPDVFYNAAQTTDDRCEEMKVLDIRTPERPRSASPKQSLLEL